MPFITFMALTKRAERRHLAQLNANLRAENDQAWEEQKKRLPSSG